MPVEPSKSSSKQTLVEEGTEFKGTLNSSCPVVINGKVEGELNAPEVTITPTGAVLGAIKARKLRAQGILSGSIDANDVFISGTIKSNTVIRAKSLEVRLTPERGKLEVTFGECTLDVGDEPVKESSLESTRKAQAEIPAPLPAGVAAAFEVPPFPDASAKAEADGANKDKKKDSAGGDKPRERGAKNGRDSTPPGPL